MAALAAISMQQRPQARMTAQKNIPDFRIRAADRRARVTGVIQGAACRHPVCGSATVRHADSI